MVIYFVVVADINIGGCMVVFAKAVGFYFAQTI